MTTSDSLSSDYEDDNNWTLELETVLLESCDFFKLRSICRDRPIPSHLRNEVWKICLNVNTQIDPLENFNDLFDLPNQDLLHDNCCEFVAKLPKELFSNSIGFISDIEVILTYFSRTYKIDYEENNGWLSILRILCCELKLNKRGELYSYFSAICHRFLPGSSVLNREIFSVFRLLLQYHDPELCSFLDTQKISPEMYTKNWFISIFSSDVPIDALVKLWDIYFLVADPFLMFYLALIVLLNLKESLLEMRFGEKSSILTKIKSILHGLASEDVEDFYSLAQHYVDLTPKSFNLKFSPILFGNANKEEEIQILLDSLCMPISIHELLESKSRDMNLHSIKYFLVDCRPAEQYNAGHLPSAFFLDSSLILTSPSDDFQTSVHALLQTQQQALEFNSESAGEHICFLGSGHVEEDQIVNMVVSQFLQKMTKYVSMVFGGYQAIHEVLGPQCDNFFTGHDSSKCQVCVSLPTNENRLTSSDCPIKSIHLNSDKHSMNLIDSSSTTFTCSANQQNKSMEKLLTKFSSAIKVNSSKFKSRFVSYVAFPTDQLECENKSIQTTPKRHYSQQQLKNAKTYRNTGNIFSIEDEGDQDNHEEPDSGVVSNNNNNKNRNRNTVDISTTAASTSPEMINLDLWMKKPDVLAMFECCVVDEAAALQPGYLLLTTTHLFVLRKSVSKFDTINSFLGRNTSVQSQNIVSIYRRRVLSSVVKITSKKRFPECLTFHYLMNDGCTIEQDRYVIEKAGEAARIIKIQVQKMIDEEDAH